MLGAAFGDYPARHRRAARHRRLLHADPRDLQHRRHVPVSRHRALRPAALRGPPQRRSRRFSTSTPPDRSRRDDHLRQRRRPTDRVQALLDHRERRLARAPFPAFPATPTSSPPTSTTKTACSSATSTPTRQAPRHDGKAHAQGGRASRPRCRRPAAGPGRRRRDADRLGLDPGRHRRGARACWPSRASPPTSCRSAGWCRCTATRSSSILDKAKHTIIVENNYSGQFARYLRSETSFVADGHIRKYDGEPFMPHHIVEAVREQLAGGTTTLSVPVHEVMV